jgi:ubiquinone biosynthesis O-methyltransferase
VRNANDRGNERPSAYARSRLNHVVEPSEYADWRGSRLGALTERIEKAAILHLAGDLHGKRLLDLGCGDGTYSIAASKKGARVTGLDISESMLAAAKQRAMAMGVSVEWSRASAEAIPCVSDTFDIVLAVTILCFVREPEQVIREVHRALRPGGAFVIGELGRYSSWALERRVRGWLASSRWREAHFWSLGELRRLLKETGFQVTASRACVYYPPFRLAARALGEHDHTLSFLGQFGAAFLVVRGEKL